ncbi:MAG: tetratricopeptide repeat protein [Opitutales bacterium]
MFFSTRLLCLLAAVAALASPGARAQVYPLSPNFWNNPEFVERFKGSYGVLSEVEPRISVEERDFLEEIAPLMSSNEQEAIRRLREFRTAQSSAALDYLLGNLFYQASQFDQAVPEYERAIKKFPTFLRAYKNLGLLHVRNGRFDEGVKFLVKTLELGGVDGDLLGLLGLCYLNQGKFNGALNAYRQALVFSPDSRDWKLGLIQCLVNTGEFRQALASSSELLKEDPGQPDLILLQANAYLSLQEFDNAIGSIEMVRRMGRADSDTLFLLGDIYINEDVPSLAVDAYLAALENADQVKPRVALQAAEVLLGRNALAESEQFIATLREKIGESLSPAQELAVLNLEAELALARGNDDEAAEKLERITEQDPLNGKALILLADYYAKNDEAAEAAFFYERAAKVAEFEARALTRHAQLLVSQSEFSAAANLLERAQLIDPRPNRGDYLLQVRRAARSAGL